jgi:hypothetical protein
MSHIDDTSFPFEDLDLTGAQSQTASASHTAAAPFLPAAQSTAPTTTARLSPLPSSLRSRRRSSSNSLLAGANNSFEALRRALSGAPELRPSASGAHLYISSGADFDFVPPDIEEDMDDQLTRLSSRLSLLSGRDDSRSVLRLSTESLSALLDTDRAQSAAVAVAAAAAARQQQAQQSQPTTATSAYAYSRGLQPSVSVSSNLFGSTESLSSLWLSKTLMPTASAAAAATTTSMPTAATKATTAPTKPTWFLGDAAETGPIAMDVDGGACTVTHSPPLASELPYEGFSLDEIAFFEEGGSGVDAAAAAAPSNVSAPLTSDSLCFLDALNDEDYAKFDSRLPSPPERVEQTHATSHLLPGASPSAAVAKVKHDHKTPAATGGLRRVSAIGHSHSRPMSAMSCSSVATTTTSGVTSATRRKPVRETKRQRESRLKQVTERNVELKRNLEAARSVVHETLHLVYLVWQQRQLA